MCVFDGATEVFYDEGQNVVVGVSAAFSKCCFVGSMSVTVCSVMKGGCVA